jgi:hypothetical protein
VEVIDNDANKHVQHEEPNEENERNEEADWPNIVVNFRLNDDNQNKLTVTATANLKRLPLNPIEKVMPRTILKNLQTRQHCAVGFTLLVRQ